MTNGKKFNAPLSEKAKKDLLKEIESLGVDLSGQNLQWVEKIIGAQGCISNADDLVDIIKNQGLLQRIADFVVKSNVISYSAASVALGMFGMAGILFGVIGNIISLVNALQAGDRVIGVKAIAHTVPAWAFDLKPLPPTPPQAGPTVKDSLERISAHHGAAGVQKIRLIWQQQCQKTIQNLNSGFEIEGKVYKNDVLKQIFLLSAGGNPVVLGLQVYDSYKLNSPVTIPLTAGFRKDLINELVYRFRTLI